MRPLAPTPAQRNWQGLELGIFCHFGINTFHGVEWSDGTLPARSFNPTEFDAAQWVGSAVAAGARYFVLTAKHHDGFCLWPTETTDYSVASSPWRDGRGDVVAEVARACAQASMPLGLYLSPWDRNAPCYDDPPAYDEFYLRQLTELCTWYGPLVELWFDGAGSQGRQYDWPAINAVIAEHQPQAMVFNMGEATIRWVGNEDGLAHDPVHYVVEETDFSNYTEQTTSLDRARYLPPECDVSLRRGWFWSAADEPKSLQHLLAIYYSSVGMGANLLLNVPPDNRGLIGADDQARLQQWRAELDRRFATPSAAELTSDGATWVADFGRDVTLDHLELAEDYSRGQWIGAHQVHSADQLLASGQTVGHRRIHTFAPVSTDRLHITLDDEDAVLAAVRGYATGGAAPGTVGYLASTEQPQ